MDVDGGDNTVYMSESYAEPIGPDNPYGLSVVLRNVPLSTESEGKQDVNFETQRAWKVVNTNVVNGLGTHPSYKLVPSGAIPMMFDPESPVFQRATVIGHTLWVTPNSPDERWPAGEFVNQSERTPAWPMDEGRQEDREHRRRALVRVRYPPHHPAGGLAGDAGRRGVVLAQAVWLLRPQPGAGRRRHPTGHLPHTSTSADHSSSSGRTI